MKIRRFNENITFGNWDKNKIDIFINNYNDFIEGLRRYILWKKDVDIDDDVLPQDFSILDDAIDVHYWDVSGNDIYYSIEDVDEFKEFLVNPNLFWDTKKYNL